MDLFISLFQWLSFDEATKIVLLEIYANKIYLHK